MSVTILIVDDHEVVREGVRTIINGRGPSGKSAVKLLTVKRQSIRPRGSVRHHSARYNDAGLERT